MNSSSSSSRQKPWDSSIERFLRTAWDVPEDTTVGTLMPMIYRAPYGLVMITRHEKELSGILTQSDLVKLRDVKPETLAKEVATRTVVAVPMNASVADTLDLMSGRNSLSRAFKQLPVLNPGREVLGVVIRKELEDFLNNPSKGGTGQTLSY
jgi:CBS-domain-containing membrane protein